MSLVRNFLSVGAATMASRVLGFARDVLLAANLGTGPVNDAFVVAFKLPNLFRRLFAEGAFNSAFVPLYARALEGEGEDGARRFAAEIFAGLFFVLVIFSGIAMIAAPALVLAMAPGFSADPEKFDLTVLLTQICFPYLACMSLTAMFAGILNAHRRFLLAASAPILLNLILVAVLAAIAITGLSQSREAGIVLSFGVMAAGFAQLAMVTIGVTRGGWSFPIRRPRLTPGVRRLIALGIPGVIAGGITQINIMIGTIIASLEPGAVSFLYYADRIYQLPLGVVGIAIGVVLLPEIARLVRGGKDDHAFHAQNRSLEFACVLTFPAAVALIVIAIPIIEVLFERGAFGPDDTLATAYALAAFGVGLPAFVFIKVFSPGFFAREDTKTPMWFAGVSMVVNVVGSIALFPVFGHVGIAAATSLAGWVNAGLLWWTLGRRGQWRTDAQIVRRVPRLIAAALVMGAVLLGVAVLLSPYLAAEAPIYVTFSALAVLCVSGLVTFFAVAHLIGGVDLAELRGQLRRRGPVAEAPAGE